MIAAVTGGTRGIGRGIANAFAEAGHTVVVIARAEPADLALPFVAADLRLPEQVERAVDEIVRQHGAIDVWINNAGGSPPADSATASPRFSEAILKLNLLAPLVCAQRANAVMQRQASGGVIVNIASVSAMRQSPTTAAYGAAKAGLIQLTSTLAVEWAPKVRVNAVSPGMVATELSPLHYPDLAAVASTVPLRRMGTPDDVAAACLWLASPAAAYVSGANLVVHGGGERPAFLVATEKKT